MEIFLILFLLECVCVTMGYFADWSMLARDKQPTCVDIPSNMTLCQNIGKIIHILNSFERRCLFDFDGVSINQSWI